MNKVILATVSTLCFCTTLVSVQAQKLKKGCQRVPVTYEESTAVAGNISGAATGVFVNGEFKGNYSTNNKKKYTIKETICPKSTPQPVTKPTPQPVTQPTPKPVPKPTPQPVTKLAPKSKRKVPNS